MNKKLKKIIKITSIIFFLLIAVAFSEDNYTCMKESANLKVVDSLYKNEGFLAEEMKFQNQRICPTHKVKMEYLGEGMYWCVYCTSQVENEANQREEAEAKARAREAEAKAREVKSNTYKCKWCSKKYYSEGYTGYAYKYSNSNKCFTSQSYMETYCSPKCATEACWSQH